MLENPQNSPQIAENEIKMNEEQIYYMASATDANSMFWLLIDLSSKEQQDIIIPIFCGNMV